MIKTKQFNPVAIKDLFEITNSINSHKMIISSRVLETCEFYRDDIELEYKMKIIEELLVNLNNCPINKKQLDTHLDNFFNELISFSVMNLVHKFTKELTRICHSDVFSHTDWTRCMLEKEEKLKIQEYILSEINGKEFEIDTHSLIRICFMDFDESYFEIFESELEEFIINECQIKLGNTTDAYDEWLNRIIGGIVGKRMSEKVSFLINRSIHPFYTIGGLTDIDYILFN